MGVISGKIKNVLGATIVANIEKWSLIDCGIYDPDDNSPEIRNLIEGQKPGWRKELVEAVAQYEMDILKREFGGLKNTEL